MFSSVPPLCGIWVLPMFAPCCLLFLYKWEFYWESFALISRLFVLTEIRLRAREKQRKKEFWRAKKQKVEKGKGILKEESSKGKKRGRRRRRIEIVRWVGGLCSGFMMN